MQAPPASLHDLLTSAPETPLRQKLIWLEQTHTELYHQAIKSSETLEPIQRQLSNLASLLEIQANLDKKQEEIDRQRQVVDGKRNEIFEYLWERTLYTHTMNVAKTFIPPGAVSAMRGKQGPPQAPDPDFPSPLSILSLSSIERPRPLPTRPTDECGAVVSELRSTQATSKAQDQVTILQSPVSPSAQSSSPVRRPLAAPSTAVPEIVINSTNSPQAARIPQNSGLDPDQPRQHPSPLSLSSQTFSPVKGLLPAPPVAAKTINVQAARTARSCELSARINDAFMRLCLCGARVVFIERLKYQGSAVLRMTTAWNQVMEAMNVVEETCKEAPAFRKSTAEWNGPAYDHFTSRSGQLNLNHHSLTPLTGDAACTATAIELGDYGLIPQVTNGELIALLEESFAVGQELNVLLSSLTVTPNQSMQEVQAADGPWRRAKRSPSASASARPTKRGRQSACSASYAEDEEDDVEAHKPSAKGRLQTSGNLLAVFFDRLLLNLRLIAFRNLSTQEWTIHPRFQALVQAARDVRSHAQRACGAGHHLDELMEDEDKDALTINRMPLNAMTTAMGHRYLYCTIVKAFEESEVTSEVA